MTTPQAMIRIPPRLYERVSRLAESTGRPRTYYLRKAVEQYLEDNEDTELAMAAKQQTKKKFTLDEAAKKLGVVL